MTGRWSSYLVTTHQSSQRWRLGPLAGSSTIARLEAIGNRPTERMKVQGTSLSPSHSHNVEHILQRSSVMNCFGVQELPVEEGLKSQCVVAYTEAYK
jgi:hypothetical protein